MIINQKILSSWIQKLFGLIIPLLLIISSVAAEKKGETKGLLGPWKATTELSYVVTSGNTSTSTFSLGINLTRKWAKDTLTFKSFMLRSSATTFKRRAEGTETDFEVIEESTKELVAENYLLSGQYERNFSEKLRGQLGVSWERNKFSGIDRRYMLIGGLGYSWVDTEKTQIKMDAGITCTSRKYIDQGTTSFAGFRFNLFAEQKLSDKSSVTSQFIFDDNLKDTQDWRYDWTNSITASISRSLALKTSYRILHTNSPAMTNLPLYDLEGQPTGLTVPFVLKKLDTFFTTSIVINF
jgi:putative salt-induced outer membrane protein YdiY